MALKLPKPNSSNWFLYLGTAASLLMVAGILAAAIIFNTITFSLATGLILQAILPIILLGVFLAIVSLVGYYQHFGKSVEVAVNSIKPTGQASSQRTSIVDRVQPAAVITATNTHQTAIYPPRPVRSHSIGFWNTSLSKQDAAAPATRPQKPEPPDYDPNDDYFFIFTPAQEKEYQQLEQQWVVYRKKLAAYKQQLAAFEAAQRPKST